MTFFLPATPPDSTPESIQLNRCYNELIQEFTDAYPNKNWDHLYRYFDRHYGIKVDPVYRYTTEHNQVQVSHLNLDLFQAKASRQVLEQSVMQAAEALASGDFGWADQILKTAGPDWIQLKTHFDGVSITVPGAQDEVAEFARMFDNRANSIHLDVDQVINRLRRFDPDDAYDITHWTAQRLQDMLDENVPTNMFLAEADRWLLAIMVAARDSWDPPRVMRVWLTEYELPLQPTKMDSFDHFHKTYGSIITDGVDKSEQELQAYNQKIGRYYSARYKKKILARSTEWADHVPTPLDLPAVTVSTSQTQFKYTQYKTADGSIVYKRTDARLTLWQVIKQWAQRLIDKNNKNKNPAG